MKRCLALLFLVVLTTSFSIVRETLWVGVACFEAPKLTQVITRVMAAPTKKEAIRLFQQQIHRSKLDQYPLSRGESYLVYPITENEIIRK